MYDFKTFAQMNLDMIFKGFPRMPELGEEVFAENFSMQLGGGPQVIPLVLKDLGCNVCMGTFMKDDTASSICRMLLQERGFADYSVFETPIDDPVVVTSVFSWPQDRAFLAHNMQAREDLLSDEVVYEFLRDARVVFAPCGHKDVVRRLHEDGVWVVYDSGWNDNLSLSFYSDVLPYIDLFTPNDKEAMKMTGTESIEEAIRILAEYTPRPCITLGRKGCIVWDGQKICSVPAYEAFDAVDTTGAGDNFLAGVIYGMIQEYPLLECIRIGNIFAAYSTSALGCFGRRFDRDFLTKHL